ncbi:IS66 family transposase zinc-finger binding domain-containing protein [Polaromonas sp.]|uniref:IS66 family transposase zinc-finger binding domain-containing protein n=1 Tax=Polaromonas sp. TaxID=1869339 RepID=UPI003BB77747
MHLASSDCTCQECGAGLRQIGQDASEVLEYSPGSFQGHAPRAPQVRLRPLPHDRAGERAEPPY